MTEAERRLLIWVAELIDRELLTAAEADEIDRLIADVERSFLRREQRGTEEESDDA